MPEDLDRILEDVFRREWPALVGAAARITGDLARAEEVAQDVLVAALDRWPFAGVPERPAAWLITAVRNRARNRVRDDARARAREVRTAGPEVHAVDEVARGPIDDDRLRLILTCCHPVLAVDAQIALTLRMVGGLATPEIARSFLVPTSTMSQRLVRAKRALAAAEVAFELPSPAEWSVRLPGVLTVIYLIFNEGYAASAGQVLTRPALCEDARRMAHLLVELLPEEGEVRGLHALTCLLSARLATRVDGNGDLVLLEDQDRSRWDQSLLAAGEASIESALRLGPPGPTTLQAMIAACHTRAPTWESTNWPAIVALYDELVSRNPSPVVELNRAVASSMIDLEDAWPVIDTITERLPNYAPARAARADALRRLGRHREAVAEYERAAQLDQNDAERHFLLRRIEECRALLGHGSARRIGQGDTAG